MKFKKPLRYLLIAVVLLIIVAIIGKKRGMFGKPETIDVVVENPAYRTLIESVSANGKIEPVIEVKISPEVSGEIIELPVNEGDRVSKGQLLCRIKPDTYVSIRERTEASVNSSKARLAQVQAQLQQSELAYNRSKMLYEQKAISESEHENAKTSFEVAKADVNAALFNISSAEASLKEAKENLAKTTIYAPMDGTISKLSVELGERVVGTAQMAGTEILRIADLTRMEARVSVNENDIVRVKLNDTSLIYVDAYPDQKFKGLVTQIANSASVTGIATDQVTTFEVRVLLMELSYRHLVDERKPNPFRPGMSTTVDIQTTTKFNVLSVPIQAVTTRSDSVSVLAKSIAEVKEGDKEKANNAKLKEVIFVAKGDTAVMVYVKSGIQDNRHIEILEGLSDSVEVVVGPFSAISRRLQDGKLVKKVSQDKLFQNP
ncbi:MAG: efflux RND transporter periplasmic adaptor subunit [Bacteroidales bacterium]|nr:efflux RND transporter periplasmic adaptor subunit [Bacteroidales bacterium]MDD3890733.1 efflux RND transporter periplasmic adaptor subunit [Bacteroidales bacterium]